MKRMTQSWLLPCSAEAFWTLFFDADYTRALYLEAFRFNDYRVISNDGTTRKLHVAPRVNLPGPLAKLAGDKFAYEQHGSLDRGRGVFSWKMVHPGGKGMVSSEGSIRVVDAGPGEDRCNRTDDVTVTGNVFGLGGLIESAAEKELLASWGTEIEFLKRWLAEH
jgi:hypothetical protein